ncbi:hypothetical protein [Parafrigoribacterium humi]|uniref:hypothetical protein n=1 Tax=Parafrigoribacterium humi TaxID=3144664 RepID=UPI0032F0731A
MLRSRLWADDDGNAPLEFITAGLILLLLLVYLVLVVSALQAGSLAVEGAARQAVRVFVQAHTVDEAEQQAERAIQFALRDYGLDAHDATVSITCEPNPNACLTRLGTVTVNVAVSVRLPLVPSVVDVSVPLAVPLKATATEQVSRFWSGS